MKDTRKPAKPLELLAPARDVQVARAAIIHGADAVYIGPENFGARSAATNSTEDIARLCDWAHQYRARIYATVNTIIHDNELKRAERLAWDLYRAGVDALIVQDMGLLRLDLPPIELHASTQCDTRTVDKAKFLEQVGFSQIVLARELTLAEIRQICRSVQVPIEVFIHGALCVSYSGRCHVSQALAGRSANRGECAQYCRQKYDMIDGKGKVLAKGKHILSLHDLNSTSTLRELVGAGASSFKIEGRLKDAAYVKNITAHYRRLLDEIIDGSEGEYCRSSAGKVELTFKPAPEKSFNRGFSTYFQENRTPRDLASIHTPKSLGEPLSDLSDVRPGDGLAFFDNKGNYDGFLVNGMRNGLPVPNRRIALPAKVKFYRTSSISWERLMLRPDTSTRLIDVKMSLFPNRLEVSDERGCHIVVPHSIKGEAAKTCQDLKRYFCKLGGTIYRLADFQSEIGEGKFLPPSELTSLRRKAIEALDRAATLTYRSGLRRKENLSFPFPAKRVDFTENICNSLAERFYKEHGAEVLERALEQKGGKVDSGTLVMTTRYCPLRQLGVCLKEQGNKKVSLPLILRGASRDLRLKPICDRCECEIRLG